MDEIGRKHGTDKSSMYHGYLSNYEIFFSDYRNKEVKILEVGVLNGASLKTWQEYFPKASVIGADINPAVRQYAGDRITIEIIDQSNVEDLVRLAVKHGPFDIIIEDGSHFWEHQITSLRMLFPFVKEGGIYVVEDLQVNYGRLADRYRGVSSISCTEYLKKLLDYHVADEMLDLTKEEDSFLRTYGNSMSFVTYFRHACLIKKGAAARRKKEVPYWTGDLLFSPAGEKAIPVSVVGHIGYRGDVIGEEGCVGGNPNNTGEEVQSFRIVLPEEHKAAISYRARLHTGAWTEWAPASANAGTRGKKKGLSGFTVRLNFGMTNKYAVRVAGRFAGVAEPVIVGADEPCVAPENGGLLTAMQVELVPRN